MLFFGVLPSLKINKLTFGRFMAFVTRCPYCGAVWLLPDKDTAERGPVRCSSCNHSFDATRALLCVDDAALPNLPQSTLPKFSHPEDALVKPEANPAEASAFAPDFFQKRKDAPNVNVRFTEPRHEEPVKQVEPPVEKPVEEPVDAPKKPEADVKPEENLGEVTVPTDEALSAIPALVKSHEKKAESTPAAGLIHVTRSHDEPKLSPLSGAIQNQFPGKTEPSLNIAGLGPKQEPKLTGVTPLTEKPVKQSPRTPERMVPAADVPKDTIKVKIADEGEVKPVVKPKRSRSYTGVISVLLALILLSALALVSAIVFNQKLIEAFPQTQGAFTQLCGKIPCPGFYLAQPEAFVVSKTTLRPVDESGNYSLDVTIVNGSNFAQAVPWLELELLDDNNGSLMKRTLTPQDYLTSPQTTKSIAPNRSLTIRVSLQTNVTSARCVVKPTYPTHQ